MKKSEFERYSMFVKTFPSFLDGMKEVRQCVFPLNQSVASALEKVPQPDVMIRVSDALELLESYVMFALMHQAYGTPNQEYLKYVFAKASMKGFTYRTKSGFIFGWRKYGKTQIYRFFVVLGPSTKFSWTEAETKQLEEAGWHKLKRKQEIASNQIADVISLSV